MTPEEINTLLQLEFVPDWLKAVALIVAFSSLFASPGSEPRNKIMNGLNKVLNFVAVNNDTVGLVVGLAKGLFKK